MRVKNQSVSVKVHIPLHLGHYTDGILEVKVLGTTVGDVLHNVVSKFPRLGIVLFPDDDQLDEFINIALGERILTAQDNRLAMPVKEGDEIAIIYPIAGG